MQQQRPVALLLGGCCCLVLLLLLLLGWRAGVGSVEPCPVSLAPGSLHLQLSFSSVQTG